MIQERWTSGIKPWRLERLSFPLSLWDIGLWIAITAIILLITSELLAPYSDYFGDFVIEKKRLRIVAVALGVAFMVTVSLRALVFQ